MVPEYESDKYLVDRDYGDENDFNEWGDEQYEEFDDEEDFYLDPEYWNYREESEENWEDKDNGEAGTLALV